MISSTGKPEFNSEQHEQILRTAARQVCAAVESGRGSLSEPLPVEIGGTPVYGAFVSLKRAGKLRSCCGSLGNAMPLGQAVDHAAERAALDDPRFPPITADELDQLDVEVWILWQPEPVQARGEARAGAVEIGRHGVQIARGSARGLLLPGVAVEHRLDAEAFLCQVCLKAGLPVDAWKQDDTELMTFDGYAIHGKVAILRRSPARRTAEGPGMIRPPVV
ncbi:MAG: AmmeMemoRadiSam system protein A, partial [Patescibacteria group bacterium]|nr:AmmeMemoRadiSam system protein A [Patescibacteria group bacterium]